MLKLVKNYFLGKTLSEAFSESLSFLSRLLNCQVLKRKRFFLKNRRFVAIDKRRQMLFVFEMTFWGLGLVWSQTF